MKLSIYLILLAALFVPTIASGVEVIVGDRVANDDIPFCGG